MRPMGLALFSLCAGVLTTLGSYAESEPAKKPAFAFSVAFDCGLDERGTEKGTKEYCLADSFKAGLEVVLVSKEGNRSCRTASTFTTQNASNEFTATHLVGTEKCFGEGDAKGIHIAVVGVDASAVHVVKLLNDKAPLPKETESKAREIASAAYKKLSVPKQPVRRVADSAPEVFSAGPAAFLLFQCTDDFLNQDGLPVLVLNNKAFLLEGSCAFRAPFFFTVNDKLHVSYWATVVCCGCGDSNFFVYDLSRGSPRLVYQNGNFSD